MHPKTDRSKFTPIPCVEITVVEVKGSAPREAGTRMYWYPGGRTEETIGGGNLEQQSIEEAGRLWNDPARKTAFLEFPLSAALGQCCGWHVRVFLCKRLPPVEVLICGAGHVSTALAHILADSPFKVTVVDPREEWAAPGRFPGKIEAVADDPEAFLREWVSQSGRAERTYL
ncbi:XdhC family protein, partial [Candidatus Sumerlaeota bacterium]|nr:XdhC family protein [Candidatus Sumerlaeota bacterium]